MSAASKKHEEGCELVRQAEKSLKVTLLKWRPDYDSAADEYFKAATAFRIAKSYDKSRECLQKAVECYKNNHSWFHAAKSYEQLILILKETDKLVDIEEYANKACSLYQQHGSPESAASALDKAAKMVEQYHPEIALRLYQHALEVVMIEDSTRHAAEYASKVSRLLVKLRRFDQASEALQKEIDLNQQTESYGQIGRLTVALVLVQLARGDSIAADKSFKQWGNCCDPQEVSLLQTLIEAYDNEDAETAALMLSSPFIKHMDVEYAILARSIELPNGIKSPLRQNNESKSIDSNAAKDEEIAEDDDGLC